MLRPTPRRNTPAGWFRPAELEALLSMLERKVNSPRTSSMGRLFDAVAALCGLPPVISFEGQAAMALEFAADETIEEAYIPCRCGRRPLPHRQPDSRAVIDWEPLMRARLLADRAAGVRSARISARFHNGLAAVAVAVAKASRPAGAAGRLDRRLFSKCPAWPPALGPVWRPQVFRCILIGKCRRATAASPWARRSWPASKCGSTAL